MHSFTALIYNAFITALIYNAFIHCINLQCIHSQHYFARPPRNLRNEKKKNCQGVVEKGCSWCSCLNKKWWQGNPLRAERTCNTISVNPGRKKHEERDIPQLQMGPNFLSCVLQAMMCHDVPRVSISSNRLHF